MQKEIPLDVYSKSWVILMTLLEKRLYFGWLSRKPLAEVYRIVFGKDIAYVEERILTNVMRGSSLIMRIGENHFWPLGCRVNKYSGVTEVFVNTGEIGVWNSLTNELQENYIKVDEQILYNFASELSFRTFYDNRMSIRVKEKIKAGECQNPWENEYVKRAQKSRDRAMLQLKEVIENIDAKI